MKTYAIRLIVPSLLGLAGFGINYATINSAIQPVAVLAVRESIPAGQRINASALVSVDIPGMTQALRENFIPAGAVGVVVGRKTLRALEPNQILLYSDLDSRKEQPSHPDNSELIYIPLDRLPCRRDLLQPGSLVHFLVKSREDEAPARIGPYEVYEAPRSQSDRADREDSEGVDNAVGLILDRAQADRVRALHQAIARDTLRAIEIESR